MRYLSEKLKQMDIVALSSAMSAKKAVDRPFQEKSIIDGIQTNTFLTNTKITVSCRYSILHTIDIH